MEFFFLIDRVWPEILIWFITGAYLLWIIGRYIYGRIHGATLATLRALEKKPPIPPSGDTPQISEKIIETGAIPASKGTIQNTTEPITETIEIYSPIFESPVTIEVDPTLSTLPVETEIAPIELGDPGVEIAPLPPRELPPPPAPRESETPRVAHIEKLSSLVANARTLIARGHVPEAQTIIIEGLSLDKNHRDLNLLLGQIYEQGGAYDKAEYIYKDLAEISPNDTEILEKLGNVLIIEKKYHIAAEIYKKIHTESGDTETTLYMLTHIYNTMGDHENTYFYAKKYIKKWPRNPEILMILGNMEISLGHTEDAIETFRTLKNITPYNNEINDILQKLLIERELAGNFRGEEVR